MSFSVSLVRAKTLVQIRDIPSLLTSPLLTDLSGKTLGKTLGTDGYSCSHQAWLRVSQSKSYFVLFFTEFSNINSKLHFSLMHVGLLLQNRGNSNKVWQEGEKAEDGVP